MSASRASSRLRPFATSIFTEMTELAERHQALNLGQGFPDFEGPLEVLDAAVEALRGGRNQYCRSAGVPELVEAVAAHMGSRYGLTFDPWTEVTITCGATEALFATFQGLLEPGDEVIAFEPFYDAYPAGVAAAGGVLRTVRLEAPAFRVEAAALEAAIGPRTRAVLVNSPHNPTGRVLDRGELAAIAELCLRHDLIAVADEVYEHLVFADDDPHTAQRHAPIACIDGMAERTITISSMGKSYSFTGWKVGWACAPKSLSAAVRAAHQFTTFCTPAPLQLATARALTLGDGYFGPYRDAYRARRDLLCRGLGNAGFGVHAPQGTYFVLADLRPLGWSDDLAFCRMLPAAVGVAAIPPSVFYAEDDAGGEPVRYLARFSFAKRRDVLAEAIARLGEVPRGELAGGTLEETA